MNALHSFIEVAFLSDDGKVSKTKIASLVGIIAVIVAGRVQPAWLEERLDSIVELAALLAVFFLRDAVRKSNQ